jgi:hypothetical protein
MKTKLTTDRGVWIDGHSRGLGYEADLDDAIAEAMIANGFAEEVKAVKIAKKVFNAKD